MTCLCLLAAACAEVLQLYRVCLLEVFVFPFAYCLWNFHSFWSLGGLYVKVYCLIVVNLFVLFIQLFIHLISVFFSFYASICLFTIVFILSFYLYYFIFLLWQGFLLYIYISVISFLFLFLLFSTSFSTFLSKTRLFSLVSPLFISVFLPL